jgi:hypothetical protein
MTKQAKRKRRRGGGASGKKKGGVLMGMRSGFKGAANVATGQAEPQTRRGKIINQVVTILLVAVVAYVVYTRFLK